MRFLVCFPNFDFMWIWIWCLIFCHFFSSTFSIEEISVLVLYLHFLVDFGVVIGEILSIYLEI